jgi:hypothetical protein
MKLMTVIVQAPACLNVAQLLRRGFRQADGMP